MHGRQKYLRLLCEGSIFQGTQSYIQRISEIPHEMNILCEIILVAGLI